MGAVLLLGRWDNVPLGCWLLGVSAASNPDLQNGSLVASRPVGRCRSRDWRYRVGSTARGYGTMRYGTVQTVQGDCDEQEVESKGEASERGKREREGEGERDEGYQVMGEERVVV